MNTYQLIATDRPAKPRKVRNHKFCADCRHHRETRVMFIVPDHYCGHPSVCHPVTRQPLLRCDDMRHTEGKCGKHAKLYEAAVLAVPPTNLLTTDRISELFGRHIAGARA